MQKLLATYRKSPENANDGDQKPERNDFHISARSFLV